MEVSVLNRRATLFVVPPIEAITEDNLQKYISAFSDLKLLPSVNKGLALKITPQGVIQETVISIEMKLIDDSFKVTTGPDRFDIFSNQKEQDLKSFLEKLHKTINAIKQVYTGPITRLALCSTFLFNMDLKALQNSYIKITQNKDEYPVEWQLRKVLRSELGADSEITINNVSTISRNIVQIETKAPADVVILDVDINTLVGTDVNLIKNLESDFWQYSADRLQKEQEYYSTLLANE